MIVRTVKDKNNPYYLKNRMAVEDGRLSWKAKGIHDYLMSKPDHWEANITEIAKAGKDGVDSVRSGVQELIDHGYMRRVRATDDKGKVIEWRLDTFEIPDVENPDVENPILVINDLKRIKNVVSNCDAAQSPPVGGWSDEDIPQPLSVKEDPETTPTHRQPKRKTQSKSPSPRKPAAPPSPESAACWDMYLQMIKEYEPKTVLAFARERKGINDIAKAGRTPEDIEQAFRLLKKTPFWQSNHLSAQSLGQQMGAVLAGREGVTATVQLDYAW